MTDSKELKIARHWQAGETGCGQLAVSLKWQLEQIRGGALLRVTATSPGAPADVPAWCRMTGHTLVHADPPDYVIRRKTRSETHTRSSQAGVRNV